MKSSTACLVAGSGHRSSNTASAPMNSAVSETTADPPTAMVRSQISPITGLLQMLLETSLPPHSSASATASCPTMVRRCSSLFWRLASICNFSPPSATAWARPAHCMKARYSIGMAASISLASRSAVARSCVSTSAAPTFGWVSTLRIKRSTITSSIFCNPRENAPMTHSESASVAAMAAARRSVSATVDSTIL